METLGQKRTRESGIGKGIDIGGIGDNRPKKTESQECKMDLSLRDLETLGQKRTRESGM